MFTVQNILASVLVKKVLCVLFKFLTLSDFIKESKPLCLIRSHIIREKREEAHVGHRHLHLLSSEVMVHDPWPKTNLFRQLAAYQTQTELLCPCVLLNWQA